MCEFLIVFFPGERGLFTRRKQFSFRAIFFLKSRPPAIREAKMTMTVAPPESVPMNLNIDSRIEYRQERPKRAG